MKEFVKGKMFTDYLGLLQVVEHHVCFEVVAISVLAENNQGHYLPGYTYRFLAGTIAPCKSRSAD